MGTKTPIKDLDIWNFEKYCLPLSETTNKTQMGEERYQC